MKLSAKISLTASFAAISLLALALCACGDDSSSSPSGGNGSDPANSSASDVSGSSSASDSVIVNPDDSTLVVPTTIAPIVYAGAWEDSASAQVKINCGTDADRIKSVDADAYIEFACSIKIEPAKGQTISLKVARVVENPPAGWVFMQSFDGERETQNDVSGPAEFGVSSAMLQVRILPPAQGYAKIEMRVMDAADERNAIVVPLLAVRTK